MSLSSIASEVAKRSGRAYTQQSTHQFKRNPSFGSIVRKVLKEVEDKKGLMESKTVDGVVEWHSCKHLTKAGDKMTCRRFFSMCCLDKCLPKYFEKKEC